MPVQVTFHGGADEVRNEMAQMLGVGFAVVPVGAAVTQAAKPAAAPTTIVQPVSQTETQVEAKPAEAPEAVVTSKTETAATTPKKSATKKKAETKPEDDNEARPVTLADIRPALKVLYALAGEKSDKPDDEGKATDSANAVMNLLSEFGVKKVSDLAEDKYGEVFAAIKTATATLEG